MRWRTQDANPYQIAFRERLLATRALACWAMAMVNRSLPALVTSLGVLATPVVGVVTSMIVLGEPFSLPLVVALVMIIGGLLWGRLVREKLPRLRNLSSRR